MIVLYLTHVVCFPQHADVLFLDSTNTTPKRNPTRVDNELGSSINSCTNSNDRRSCSAWRMWRAGRPRRGHDLCTQLAAGLSVPWKRKKARTCRRSRTNVGSLGLPVDRKEIVMAEKDRALQVVLCEHHELRSKLSIFPVVYCQYYSSWRTCFLLSS